MTSRVMKFRLRGRPRARCTATGVSAPLSAVAINLRREPRGESGPLTSIGTAPPPWPLGKCSVETRMTNVMFSRSRCRRSRVEKLRNGRDKLRWRERLLQKDAFGYALRSPLIGSRPGHVDYGKFRIDLPEGRTRRS